jgi:trk system potassium uptake protein TrkH|tara:strand:+ start:1667 stop:3127 length:1461 start_codon:yes stop_codon:yes gene_type:complete
MPNNKLINLTIVLKVLSFLLIVEGLFMLSGLCFAFYYEESFWPLLISAIITGVIGSTIWLITNKKNKKSIGRRDGYLIVSLSWIVISIFGTLPFIFSGVITNYSDAFFETISGFTTTGATVLTDIEAVPKNILFWRAMTQWLGGMGIIVLTVAILPFLGIGGLQLMIAEMPGITPDKLHPRITETAKRFWAIYVIFTISEVLLLWVGEMDFFDSVCHSFSTMATGGFSTQNNSIAGYMPYTQYVIILFMIFAGTNFTLHYFALHRKFEKIYTNEEFRTYFWIIAIISAFIALGLFIVYGLNLENSFRDALFTVVSILTTTGFVSTDYSLWPTFLWMFIFALMFIGGSAGSTGGGVKIIRHLLLIKNSLLEMKRSIHPHAIIPVKYNGRSVSQQIIFNVMAFFLIYILVFSFGTLTLSLLGHDFDTSIGATIATLGNIGPGIGDVGPIDNYAFFSPFAKWLLSFLMLLGRLEIFTVLIVISPAFWKR